MPGDEPTFRDLEAIRRELADYKEFEKERRHDFAAEIHRQLLAMDARIKNMEKNNQERLDKVEDRLSKMEGAIDRLTTAVTTRNNQHVNEGRSVLERYWKHIAGLVGALIVGAYEAWKAH